MTNLFVNYVNLVSKEKFLERIKGGEEYGEIFSRVIFQYFSVFSAAKNLALPILMWVV